MLGNTYTKKALCPSALAGATSLANPRQWADDGHKETPSWSDSQPWGLSGCPYACVIHSNPGQRRTDSFYHHYNSHPPFLQTGPQSSEAEGDRQLT